METKQKKKAHTLCTWNTEPTRISVNVGCFVVVLFFPPTQKCRSQHFRTKITDFQILGEMVREAISWTTLCFIQYDWLYWTCIVDAEDKAVIVSSQWLEVTNRVRDLALTSEYTSWKTFRETCSSRSFKWLFWYIAIRALSTMCISQWSQTMYKYNSDWCSHALRVEDVCLALQYTNASERII